MHIYYSLIFGAASIVKCPCLFELQVHQSWSRCEIPLKRAAGSNSFYCNCLQSRIRQLLGYADVLLRMKITS